MSSTGKDLAQVIGREIERVAEEIAAYRDERNLWVTQGAQRNAPGTLALHLAGNVRHYVGAGLGGTGYVRDRHAEFHDRDVPREELLSRLRLAGETAVDVLTALDEETFAEGRFAVDLPDAYADMTVRAYLVHLAWHLGWHQGQIYYHRLTGRRAPRTCESRPPRSSASQLEGVGIAWPASGHGVSGCGTSRPDIEPKGRPALLSTDARTRPETTLTPLS